MADAIERSALEQLAAILLTHGVEFIVIGGQADVGDMDLKVIDLDDLITIKQHIRRPKDRESLVQLLAIKRERESQAPPPDGP